VSIYYEAIDEHMQAQSSRPSVQQETASILLIDDEADILKIFKKFLEMSGYSTYGFVNPAAAVEHFRQNPKSYQIIITDVRMPGMSGFEVVREVREINRDVKIVMTSSFEINMNEMKAVLPSVKVDGLIEKPIKLEKLNEIVQNLLHQG
jgi:CheY-like chemotaxis protein